MKEADLGDLIEYGSKGLFKVVGIIENDRVILFRSVKKWNKQCPHCGHLDQYHMIENCKIWNDEVNLYKKR